MNETTRTLTFVGVAAVLAAAAFGMHVANQPPSLEEFSDVGEEFYADFDNPREATGLRVAAYNDEAARVDAFNVEFKNGLWRIPSHHGYPADGEERLAKTATSIIGLERGALVSTSAEDHKRLGVLDPLDAKVTGTEGRGDRITLTKGDTVLADYIVGTKVEDGPQNTWHVRRADENRTYRVTLDLDISTKFADWIEPDLLQFQQAQARELVIDRYSIDEARGVLVPGTRSELSRTSQDDPWKLAGIDEQTQQVKTSTVNQMLNALADLKIVGVRKKPAGLSANLRGEGEGGIDRAAAFDLEQKGFFIDSRGALVSNEGDFQLATADGARYVLRFGEVFTGSDVEIEVGKPAAENADQAADEAPEGDAEASADDAEPAEETAQTESGDEAEGGKGTTRSRYVFITAEFDESLIAALPEKPVKPEAPADAESKASEEAKPETEADADAEGAASETDSAADTAKEPGEDADPAEGPAGETDADKPDPKQEYEQALADYERQLKDWEAKQTQREQQIEAGQKRVQELNNRFADWYYVISAETFDKIRVAPEDLAEPLKKDDDAAAPPALPGAAPAPEVETPAEPAAGADKPADTPADDSADAPTEKPAEPKPEADADAPAGDTPAAESKPAEAADPAADAPAASSENPAEAPAEPDAADTPAEEDAAAEES